MFGYVRPVLNRLSEDEKKRYKSAYCGLCHTLGKRYGLITRFTLNYDLTFLAILIYGGEGESGHCVRRCPAHIFRKPAGCICGKSLELAADESMILTWYKLTDDVEDSSFLAGLPARLLRVLLARGYRKASSYLPAFDSAVKESMGKLKALEEARSPQLDRAADTFASILSAAAVSCTNEDRSRAMRQLLYHLGRWIYLVDAWDDLEEDRAKGRYNPLDARFSGDAAASKDYIETTMTHSARLVSAAANLIDFGEWSRIVSNVVEVGLPAVQAAVLDGSWSELRSIREKQT